MISLKHVSMLAFGLTLCTSCYTTRYQLGPKPSGKIVTDNYPVDRQKNSNIKVYGTQSAITAMAVDLSEHCKGGNVAEIVISDKLFGGGKKVEMNCAADGSAAPAEAEAAPADDKKKEKKK
jgi:hypothetical protein